EVGDFTGERDRFDGAVTLEHDGAARGFVAAAALHADIAVFNQGEAADAMLAAQAVQLGQHFGRRHALAVQGYDVALLVFDVEVFGGIRRRFRRYRPAPHVFFGFRFRVLEVAA